jgi:hypothetical protein
MRKSIRTITLSTAAVLASLFGTASSLAGLVKGTGGPLIRVDTRSDNNPLETSSTTYAALPGATVALTIPSSGGSRLIIVRFTAESQCYGVENNRCTVQIVAIDQSGNLPTVPLNPADGGITFDSTPFSADDLWEAHAMDRSIRLDPGSYVIRVQWAVVGAATTFRLDNWHLTVSQYD